MAKIEWTNDRKFKNAGSGVIGFLIGILIKIESLISLWIIIGTDTASWTDYLVLLVPIIFAVFFLGIYYYYLKISDWKKHQLRRIKKLEENYDRLKTHEVERITDNQSRIERIENNHLIQIELNHKVVDALEEVDDSPKIFLTNENPDKGIYKFIKDRNQRRIQGPQIALIVSEFRSPKNNSFYKPFSSE